MVTLTLALTLGISKRPTGYREKKPTRGKADDTHIIFSTTQDPHHPINCNTSTVGFPNTWDQGVFRYK